MKKQKLAYSAKPRDLYIDTIRGLACIALVSFHVVGDTSQSGLELPANDWLVKLQLCFADMRMPLFSFVSGYVLTSILRDNGSWFVLMRSKTRRLLLPLIAVSTLYYVLREQMNYQQPEPWQIYVTPFLHFWFLQAAFVLSMSLIVLNAVTSIGRVCGVNQAIFNATFIGCIGLVGTASGLAHGIHFFSISQAFYLAPFFMTGHVLGILEKVWAKKLIANAPMLATGFLIALVLLSVSIAMEYLVPPSGFRYSLAVFIGLGTAISLFIIKPSNRILAWIGGMSYSIYLFHVLFTASAQMFIRKIFPSVDIHYAYLPALAAGLVGPIVFQLFILKSAWLSWLVLGLRAPVDGLSSVTGIVKDRLLGLRRAR